MHTVLTEALLGYHAITGCDYVSCLFRKRKTTQFKRLIESTEHIQEMRTLTKNEVDVKGVTSFICSLYGHNTSHINDARYNVFIRLTRGAVQAHTRNIKKINCASPPPPPMSEICGKAYTARLVCGKDLERCYASDPTDGLEPVNNGWKMIGQNLEPDWYSRKCLLEQLGRDLDTDKAMVVENSDDEWTDESDDDI